MTAQGLCHLCGKVCDSFHYEEPFTGNGHHGYWHCEQHGPKIGGMSTGPSGLSSTETTFNNNREESPRLNRAERRKLARGKI